MKITHFFLATLVIAGLAWIAVELKHHEGAPAPAVEASQTPNQ